jgi:hypothetical protein
MRYIDTGGREPANALGTWLDESAVSDDSIVALRWQTGFYGASALGFFVSLFRRLAAMNGVVHVVVGSNDGTTTSRDLDILLQSAGPARTNLRVGVVRFSNAYFHPKTVHMERSDGSATAYVGSANLTKSGVESLHVEAGVLLDTREGDDPQVVASVAAAVDAWFAEEREGIYVVTDIGDVTALADSGVLNIPRPPSPPQIRRRRSRDQQDALEPLVRVPPLPSSSPIETPPGEVSTEAEPTVVIPRPTAQAPIVAEEWKKRLTKSDAQRKTTGNQRGSITLVQAGYAIDAQTYFRNDLFGTALWRAERTRTGEFRESADIPFDVELLGTSLGVLILHVTHAGNREAGQSNYTTLLHTGPLALEFARVDMERRLLTIRRLTDGSYTLLIA